MIIALGALAVYFGLLGFSVQRRPRGNPAGLWLALYCAYSVILMALHALILGERLPPSLLPFALHFRIIGFMISVGLAGALTSTYIALKMRPLLWFIPITIW